MMKHLQKSIVVIFLSLAIVSCQSGAASQQPQGDGIQDIRVNTAALTEVKVSSEEFPLPNCGGTGEIHQTLGSHASVFKSVTVGEKATLKGGGEADIPETAKLKLEIEIEASYQKTYESASSRLDTIDMPAAKGTHVVYVIGWYEQIYESIVEYSSDGKVYEVPYTYKLRIPKIEDSFQLVCDGNATTNNGQSNTAIPQPTSAPSVQTNFPDVYVASNAENGVIFTAPTDGNYRFTIKEGIYCWGGQGKCRSIIHGYLNRDIEWGLWYNLTHPINQDYEIGCWENETAANPNCSVGQSTIVAMKAQQFIRWVIMEQKGSFGDDTGNVVLTVEKLP
jgi:hypothetical protein